MKCLMLKINNLYLGFLLLSGMLFAPEILSEPASDVISSQNSIQSIDVSKSLGGVIVAKITLDQPIDTSPVGVSLSNPTRIYFDFVGVTNGLGENIQAIEEGDLRSINVVQAGNRTRLVLNLARLMSHETYIEQNSLFVKLNTVTKQQASNTTVQFAQDKMDEDLNSVRDIDFRRGIAGEGRVEVDLLHSGSGIDVNQEGNEIVIEFVKTLLPENLERKLDVIDFGTPIKTIQTTAQGNNVRMVVKPSGRWEHSAQQSDTKFILEVRALTNDEEELARKRLVNGGYTGEKLSLNFQDVEVRAVLQVIADFTNLNIIASDSVVGNLTLRLKDVPWDQALDIVLHANGLDKRKTGNVIFVAPRKEMADRELLDLESKAQVTELEPVETEIIQLIHRRVDSISFEGMLSQRGTINQDEISNTLTITDIPLRISEIKKRIKRLDVYERQVMIEARIVEATDTFSRELGARFGVQNTNQSGSYNILDSFNTNLPAVGAGLAGGPATLGLSLIKVNNSTLIDLELSALEQDSQGRVIASPRVVTAHGIEALIEQGDRVPFQQATSSGATSIRFINATLSLKVKPLITHDNQIDMELSITQDKIGESPSQFLPPAINTKKVETKVLVENGGTVVIGGIFERNETKVVNKIPLLGDIPYLGHIFQNSTIQDNKRELLVFITPRILKESLNLQ